MSSGVATGTEFAEANSNAPPGRAAPTGRAATSTVRLGIPPPRARPAAFAHDGQFERIVAALQDAALSDAAWPHALALIDDACGMHSSHLSVVDASRGDAAHLFGLWRGHGVSFDALAHEYAHGYFATDERVARLLLLPAGTLLHNADLYTPEEQVRSRTCNDFLLREGLGNQLSARLAGLDGLHTVWTVTRTSAQGAWRPAHLAVLTRLLPHVGGAVRTCQALAKAEAHTAALASLLDAADQDTGAMLLDRHGTVVQANARGRRTLAEGRLLGERDGMLGAVEGAEEERLGALIARALPRHDRAPLSGALAIGPAGAQTQVRVTPVDSARMDFGARRVAAVATLHTAHS